MATIDFPANPVPGQQFSALGLIWTWDGHKWTATTSSVPIPDAPNDGQIYGRQYSSGAGFMSWTVVATGGSPVNEAPVNNTTYGRRNASWRNLDHNDITDWTTSVPQVTTTTPKIDGTAAIGSDPGWARGDHIHPTDTSRAPKDSPTFTGTVTIPFGASIVGYAPLASPMFIGLPTTPTPATGLADFQVANTLFVSNAVTAGSYTLPQATTTTLGGVKVDGTTITAAAGVISATAATVPSNPNRLDNGDMYIDQHNSGASVPIAAGGFVVCPDRWFSGNTLAKFTVGRNYNGAPLAPGFPYFLGVKTTGIGAGPASGHENSLGQIVEFDAFNDFAWGTANAQPATLSFWVYSSLGAPTANFSVALSSFTSPYRVFITTYNIPIANTWTQIVVHIPADTTVSSTNWTGAGNAWGLSVTFDLGTGSNGQTSTGLGAWQNSATAFVASGSVKLVATSNAVWAVTGVKLEKGTVASPFVSDTLAVSLTRCQRYFEQSTSALIWFGYAETGFTYFQGSQFMVQKRAPPTVTPLSAANALNFALTPTLNGADLSGVVMSNVCTFTGSQNYFQYAWTASAEF